MAKINWTLQQFNIDDLTDYYKNPRSLSDKEFKQLKTSLDKFGMIDKPIVNADSAHTIIGGHQRKHVLEASGVKEIECWIPDRELSDKEVEELNIRLNKNTGSWDFDTLASEFELDDLLDWGFTEMDLGIYPEDEEEGAEEEEVLRPKNFMRILISVPVNSAIEVKDTIESLSDIPGIEIDYGAN
jgi:ParB-like chromosome segregation protein Spo0J